jgi:thiol-disulfide isomerase/thioredoxin
VRAVACGILLTYCLGLTGCSLFGKRSQSSSTAGDRPSAESSPTALAGRSPNGVPADPVPVPAGVGGILAGQVINSYNRAPPLTYIQVVSAQETKAAPIDVPTDKNGYFTILGLQSGQRYQLIARARDGDHLLAGTTWVTAPDARVLIRISEDLATPNTPPLPASPGWPGSKAPSTDPARPPQSMAPSTDKGSAANPSNPNAIPRRTAELTPPIKVTEVAPSPPAPGAPPSPALAPRTELRPEDITAQPNGYAQRPPAAAVPSWVQQTPTPPAGPGAMPGAGVLVPAVPPPVPSCVLTGQKLHNFALYDLTGQPWEFAHQRRGRLVLLDFWGTWCPYCVQAIPNLNILQSRYGGQGLEVIGLAYEEGSPQEQIRKIERLSKIPGKRIDYRVLLGGDRQTCPLLKQFEISCWPTLVLLDESGTIIWRNEGSLDQPKSQDLELLIRQKLRAPRKGERLSP